MKFTSTQLVTLLLATGAQAQNNDLNNILNGAASVINGIGPGVQSVLTVVGDAINPNNPTQVSGSPTVINTPTASAGSATSGQASSGAPTDSATPGASATSGSVKPTGSSGSKSSTTTPSGNSANILSAPNQYIVVAGAALAAIGTYFV